MELPMNSDLPAASTVPSREAAARRAEITTHYDPIFYKTYIALSASLAAFSLVVILLRFNSPCSMPVAWWLVANTVTSVLYICLNVYDYYNFRHRVATSYIQQAFKIVFIVFWVIGQYFILTTTPTKCDPLLWGTGFTLVLLEYLRIVFPVILFFTICWWYPLLERFIENSPYRGASKKAIESLPTKKCLPGSEKCTICYNHMCDEDEARDIPCGHEFHVKCLDEWLLVKSACPLCRAAVFIENDYV